MLPQQVSYLGEINNVVQKCAFSFLKLLINKGFGEIKCQSQELTKAILVNPYNISAIVSSIKEALEMPVEEQISRNRKMQEVLKRNHIGKWGNDMIKEILPIKE